VYQFLAKNHVSKGVSITGKVSLPFVEAELVPEAPGAGRVDHDRRLVGPKRASRNGDCGAADG
jgi:hypothetical protein